MAKTIIKNGYLVFADNPKNSVHRWKAGKKYGKEEIKGKQIHHINKDKRDNTDTNLLLVSKEDHHNIHQYENKIEFLSGMIFVLAIMTYVSLGLNIILPGFHLAAIGSVGIIIVLAIEIRWGFIAQIIKRPKEKIK